MARAVGQQHGDPGRPPRPGEPPRDIAEWLHANGLGADDATGLSASEWGEVSAAATTYEGCTFDARIRRYRRGGKAIPISGDPGFRGPAA